MPTSPRTHLLTIAAASAITLALSSASACAEDPKPKVHVRRLAVPDEMALRDWTWSGDAVFTFEGARDDRTLKRLRASGDRLIEEAAWPSPAGQQPLIIGDHELAHFDDRPTLVIIDSRTGKPKRSLDIQAARPNEQTGGLGHAAFQDGAIFFHAIHAHRDNPLPRLFRITLEPLALHALGKGYYPRPGSGGSVYFVDSQDGFALVKRTPGDNGSLGAPQEISPLECYTPAPLPNRPGIVVQNGFNPARILLIDDQGRVIRVLSGDAQLNVWPQLSPSGKFVAFTSMDDWADEEKTVHIVDMKGQVLHSTPIGDHPVSAAYRWAFAEDRIAIVAMGEGGGKAIEIIFVRP